MGRGTSREWVPGVIGTAVVGLLLLLGGASPADAYNGPAAARYADQWARSRNSYYPSFGSDCTNFVSQALHAGGFANVGGTDETNLYQWWIRRNNWGTWDYNTTWSVAWRLRQFLINHAPGGTVMGTASGASTAAYTPSSVVTGDVLFYDWGLGDGVTHAAMQVGIGTDPSHPHGRVYYGNYVDMHSTDRYHAFWSLQPYNLHASSTKVYFVHVWPGN